MVPALTRLGIQRNIEQVRLTAIFHCARTNHEQTLLQRQIEATDGQIDKLVYELYGLTEEEIKIVEEHQN